MDEKFRKALEEDGWKAVTIQEFLGLSDEDVALIEIHLALGDGLRARRLERGLTQAQLARRMRSSQSRVAKMELGSPSVSLDLLVRAMLALGAIPQEIGAIIAAAEPMNRAKPAAEESAAAD
jgi:hypothetical protein